MNVIVRRLIKLFFKLKIFSKHYVLKYDGKIVSFNELYSGGHWGKRAGIKNTFDKIFTTLLLQAKVKPMTEMCMVVFYCTRHDCDNIVLTVKFCLDSMKGKYITDDTSRYYKGIMIFHDPTLKKGMVELHIIGK
jgi:hypothetical protein